MEYKFDANNFEEEVLKSDVPVLVDFFADWCGPCKMMAPVIAQLAEDYDGKAKIGKINTDENTELAVKYGVMSIPNMKIFKGGEVVDEIVGAVGAEVIEEKLDELL